MQGRSNMASCWCMWCKMSPKQWKMDEAEVPQAHREEWTINELKQAKLRMNEGLLTEPCEIRGVVDFPEWDFWKSKTTFIRY